MPALMRIDQDGLPAGTPGVARTDGLNTGDLVTLTSVGGGSTHRFELLDVPDDDTNSVATFQRVSPTAFTFSPSPGIPGTWRIRLIVDEGTSTQSVQTRIFGVRTDAGLLIPAWNEGADPAGSLANQGARVVARSENNEPSARFPGGEPRGYYPALRELFLIVDQLVANPGTLQGAYDQGQSIDVSGDGPIRVSRQSGAAALLSLAAEDDPEAEIWPDGIRGAPFGKSLFLLGGQGNGENDGGTVWIDGGQDGGAGAGRVRIGAQYADSIESGGFPNNEISWTHNGNMVVTAGLDVGGTIVAGGLDASGPVTAPNVGPIWKWNRLDTSQFRIAFDAIGGGTAVLSRVLRPWGPVLRITFPTKVTGELSTYITLVNPGITQDADNCYAYRWRFRVCGFSGNNTTAGEWYALGPAYLCNQLTGAGFYGFAMGGSSGGVGGNGRYARVQAGAESLSGSTFAWNGGNVLSPGSGNEFNTRISAELTARHVPGNNPGWLGTFVGQTKDSTSAVQIAGGVNDTFMVTQLGAFGAGWAAQTLDTCGIWLLGRAGTTAGQWIEFDMMSVERIET